MSTSRRKDGELINFYESNQNSKNRSRKTTLIQCIQEPNFKDPCHFQIQNLTLNNTSGKFIKNRMNLDNGLKLQSSNFKIQIPNHVMGL